MRKATFAELESGSKRFIAIGVSRSKSLPKLYIGCGRNVSGPACILLTGNDVISACDRRPQFVADESDDDVITSGNGGV